MYSNYTFYFISSLQAKTLLFTALLQFPNHVKGPDQLTPEDFDDFIGLKKWGLIFARVCLFPLVHHRDVPGTSELGCTLSPWFPAVGGLFSSRDCRDSSFSHTWRSIRAIRPWGRGMGLWLFLSAPPPQLPCWQPLQKGDPRRTSQLQPAVLAAAVLRHLLGGHSWARGVRQVSAPCSAEQGRAAGCVCLERRGRRSGPLSTSG